MEGILPISELRDKRFLASIAVGFFFSLGIIAAVAFYLVSTRIIVNPIATVSVLQSAPSNSDIRPISELLGGVHRGDFKTVWAGYAANLKDLCAAGDITNPGHQAVILTQTAATTSASSVQLRPSVCEKVTASNSPETIYVTADNPFKNVTSEKKLLAIDSSKK